MQNRLARNLHMANENWRDISATEILHGGARNPRSTVLGGVLVPGRGAPTTSGCEKLWIPMIQV